jgi:hypothetical protein
VQFFLKVLSLVVIVIGAVLVYRAESIARRILEKQDIGKPRVDVCTNDDMENESVESHSKIDDIITEKAMSIKKIGLLILMAGVILVLVAFR